MNTDVPSKACSIGSDPAEWKCPEHSQVTKVKGLSSVSIQPTPGNRPCRQPHCKGCRHRSLPRAAAPRGL
jgi:hypothetical protein